MLFRIWTLSAPSLVSLVMLGVMPLPGQDDDKPPPPQKQTKQSPQSKQDLAQKKGDVASKKKQAGPEGDLTRAYDLLRRLRAENQRAGHPEPRIREWTDRAMKYYRDGVRALEDQNEPLAHEYGAIAHDLARVIHHARNATLFDFVDNELPKPPSMDPRLKADVLGGLTRAYDRLREGDDGGDAGPEAKYYRDAALDLYRGARRDFEGNRLERSGELAKAAEAMTHVAEHLGHAADDKSIPPPRSNRKKGELSSKADREGQILPPP